MVAWQEAVHGFTQSASLHVAISSYRSKEQHLNENKALHKWNSVIAVNLYGEKRRDDLSHDELSHMMSHAFSLPPYRPYECTIDLFAGGTPPGGWLYFLSSQDR